MGIQCSYLQTCVCSLVKRSLRACWTELRRPETMIVRVWSLVWLNSMLQPVLSMMSRTISDWRLPKVDSVAWKRRSSRGT